MQWGFCVSAVVRKHKLNVHLLRGWRVGKCVCVVWLLFGLVSAAPVWFWDDFILSWTCMMSHKTWLTWSRHTHTHTSGIILFDVYMQRPFNSDANVKLDSKTEAKHGKTSWRRQRGCSLIIGSCQVSKCLWATHWTTISSPHAVGVWVWVFFNEVN